MSFKSGFVALIGRTNVGKSTLFNAILGQRVSIVSDKPQTTRNRILGVYTEKDCQIVFVDTPGIHRGGERTGLNRYMTKAAHEARDDADIVTVMIEAGSVFNRLDAEILQELSETRIPLVLVINKVDTVNKPQLLPLIKEAGEMCDLRSIIPVSATKGIGIEAFLKELRALLPEGDAYFPEDTRTDHTERFLAGEIIREKVFTMTRQEIPYSTAIVVDEFKEQNEQGYLVISATVFVEKDSQKGIVIGRGGEMIKRIGTAARREIEAFFDTPVFLDLRVKVMKDWTKNEDSIKRFGYS
jgi:GTP-binding protein Era